MQIAMWTTESVGVLRRGSANLLKLTLTWAAFESESVADRLDWTSCKTRFGGAFLGIAPLPSGNKAQACFGDAAPIFNQPALEMRF